MLDFNKIELLIKDGYISRQKHPDADLFVLNYTQRTQFDQNWCEETINCRGLVVDGNNKIISRGLKKFHNIEEVDPKDIPNEPFDVFDKMDGSFAGIYFLNDKPYCYTRGSFISEQALKGTEILRKKYPHLTGHLKDLSKIGISPCFEVIYPENRIVVSYYYEDLILLAYIDNETGNDVIGKEIKDFIHVKKYDGLNDLSKLKSLEEDNAEGFVVRFKNGFRVKVKFAEYVRLHRIITCVSNLSIWDALKNNQPLDEILERVPDEFYTFVRKTKADLENEYQKIKTASEEIFKTLPKINRKEFAEQALSHKYSGVLFNMLDNRDYSKIIWKMIRPVFSKPFKDGYETN